MQPQFWAGTSIKKIIRIGHKPYADYFCFIERETTLCNDLAAIIPIPYSYAINAYSLAIDYPYATDAILIPVLRNKAGDMLLC